MFGRHLSIGGTHTGAGWDITTPRTQPRTALSRWEPTNWGFSSPADLAKHKAYQRYGGPAEYPCQANLCVISITFRLYGRRRRSLAQLLK